MVLHLPKLLVLMGLAVLLDRSLQVLVVLSLHLHLRAFSLLRELFLRGRDNSLECLRVRHTNLGYAVMAVWFDVFPAAPASSGQWSAGYLRRRRRQWGLRGAFLSLTVW